MTQEQAYSITPEQYQKTLEQLDLRSVCLDEIKACCAREAAEGEQVNLNLSAEAEDVQEDGQYLAFITYVLRGERDAEMVLEIEAKYRLIFDVLEPVPVGFFEVFQELNLRTTTMPYFRELVASMTGRMEIPTLTLPYAVYAGSAEDGEEQKAVEPAKTVEVEKKRTRKPKAAKT